MSALGGARNTVREGRRRRWQARFWPAVSPDCYVDRSARCSPGVSVEVGAGGHVARYCDVDVRSGGSVRLSANVFVDQRTRLAATGGRLEVGQNTFLGSDVILVAGDGGLKIGRDCLIGPGVWMFAENHIFEAVDRPVNRQGMSSRGIAVGDDVWIGARTLVLDGVSIGSQCVVGAGSVVTVSLPPKSFCVGSPARVIRHR